MVMSVRHCHQWRRGEVTEELVVLEINKERCGEAAETKFSQQEIIKSLQSCLYNQSTPGFYLYIPVNLPALGLQVSTTLQVKPAPVCFANFSYFTRTHRETHRTHLHTHRDTA